MVNKIFFNASLPRSGSTLLQNVMMQNPDIYSSPTSGVIEFLLTARTIYSTGDAFRAQDPEVMKKGFKGFCKGGLWGFYNSITDRPYVIDKSRAWAGNFRFLDFFEEDPKVIVMVRDLRAVFSSMEKNFRKNPHKDPQIVNSNELKNMTTDSRLVFFSTSPPVGPSLEWIKDVITQKLDSNLLFIRFEDFTTNPELEIRRIYKYLDIPYFVHDFSNVEQLTQENDVIHGIFGDHTIQKVIKPVKNDYLDILGPNNCNNILQSYAWFFEKFKYK
jgi:sulfotransferase